LYFLLLVFFTKEGGKLEMIVRNISPQEMSPEEETDALSLPSEEYTTKVLPPVLSTKDMVAIFVVTVVFISNAATAASGGAAAYVYWIVGGITFFIPTVIATAQLGVMFPHEGSIYNWTYRTLGAYWAFFVGICWWFPTVLILVSAADTIITYIQGLNPAWLTEPWQQGLAIMAILVFSMFIATRPARVSQNIINCGACMIVFATIMIGAAGVRWLTSGHPSATSFAHPADWSVNPGNFALLGLITLAYLGSQVPLNMAGEMVGGNEKQRRRSIVQHLQLGTLLVFVCYFLATFTLLVVEGPTNGATPFALIDSVDKAFGKVWGDLTVVCIMGGFVSAAILFNASFARMLFVGSVDRRIPVSMGKLNKQRVPANAILLQTLLSIVFTAVAFMLVPYALKLGSPANLSGMIYNVSLAVVSLVWALITNFFYIALFRLYRQDRKAFREKALLPVPVLLGISIIGPISCIATIVAAVLYSWIPSLIPNGSWTLTVSGVVLVCFTFVAIGSMFASSEAAWQHWTK
jgi:amino acid transporter